MTAIYGGGHHSAGFLWRHAARHSPDFFLPLNTEPFVQSDADLKVRHSLAGLDRPHPARREPASIEAEMRVELKQWLRSHWGEMSANDRSRFPDQTLFLSPGGAGITQPCANNTSTGFDPDDRCLDLRC